MAGGSRYSSGKKPDLIRNSFETVRTPAYLSKPLQQQELRCKVCMEQVSGRPEIRSPKINASTRHLKCVWSVVWKKVEEYLRLFESYGGNRFSLFLMSGLGKLVLFSGRMGLRMKFIAKKELIFLFQMAPSRILWDQ